jgi:hypothetical protein
MDRLKEKLRWFLSEAGVLKRNMFTGLHSAIWQEVAEAHDPSYFQFLCRKRLIEEFCHTVGKRFLITVKEDVERRTWMLRGFVFSEDELLDLLGAAYKLGQDERITPFSVGGMINDIQRDKEIAIAAVCSTAQVEDE